MDKQTIVRTVVLVIALVNQSLVIVGKSPLPFSEEEVELGVSAVITTLASLWAWWKNNSFTDEAQQADLYLKNLKK